MTPTTRTNPLLAAALVSLLAKRNAGPQPKRRGLAVGPGDMPHITDPASDPAGFYDAPPMIEAQAPQPGEFGARPIEQPTYTAAPSAQPLPKFPTLASPTTAPAGPTLDAAPERDRNRETRDTVRGLGIAGALSLLLGGRPLDAGAAGAALQGAAAGYDERAQDERQAWQDKNGQALQKYSIDRQAWQDQNAVSEANNGQAVQRYSADTQRIGTENAQTMDAWRAGEETKARTYGAQIQARQLDNDEAQQRRNNAREDALFPLQIQGAQQDLKARALQIAEAEFANKIAPEKWALQKRETLAGIQQRAEAGALDLARFVNDAEYRNAQIQLEAEKLAAGGGRSGGSNGAPLSASEYRAELSLLQNRQDQARTRKTAAQERLRKAKELLAANKAAPIGRTMLNADGEVIDVTPEIRKQTHERRAAARAFAESEIREATAEINNAGTEGSRIVKEIEAMRSEQRGGAGAQGGELAAFMAAIEGTESGGNPRAQNARTGAYGLYQIMPRNWPAWSREVLGYVADRTPENQKAVAAAKMQQYRDRYGSWDMAALAWFAGEGTVQEYQRARTDAQRARILAKGDGNMSRGAYIAAMRRRMAAAGMGAQLTAQAAIPRAPGYRPSGIPAVESVISSAADLLGQFPGLRLNSGLRTGNTVTHGDGYSLDLGLSTNRTPAQFRALAAAVAQLPGVQSAIYEPAGTVNRGANGRTSRATGPHVHVRVARGPLPQVASAQQQQPRDARGRFDTRGPGIEASGNVAGFTWRIRSSSPTN